MQSPPRCEKEIYEAGQHVATITGGCSQAIEALIERLRSEVPEVKVDWHYVGGRACVRVLGEGKPVKEWLYAHMPMQVSFNV